MTVPLRRRLPQLAGLAAALFLLPLPPSSGAASAPAGEPEEAECAEGHGPGGEAAGGFSDTHVLPGPYDLDGPVARVVERGPYEVVGPVFTRINVGGAAQDPSSRVDATPDVGVVNLSVALYFPGRGGQPIDGCRFPTVIVDSLYFVYFYDPARFEEQLQVRWLKPRLVENLVPHGYVVAFTSSRGMADNDGCGDVWGPVERADLVKKLDWFASRPWSDGTLALYGLSGPGITAWMGASTGHPALKTIVPLNAATDWQRWFSHRGTTGFPLVTAPGMYGVNPLSNDPLDVNAGDPAWPGRLPVQARMLAQRVLCNDVAEGVLAEALAIANGGRDPLTGDRYEHWAERDLRPGVEENYHGSVLLITGLQDPIAPASNVYPWLGGLEARGIVVKHVLGQWGHIYPDKHAAADPASRWDAAQVLLRWFDYWLKDRTSVDLGPRAQVQDSQLRWRSEPLGQPWPPADAQARAFFLARGPLAIGLGPGGAPEFPTAGRLADAAGAHPAQVVVPPVADHVPFVPDESGGTAQRVCRPPLPAGGDAVPSCPVDVNAEFGPLPDAVELPCDACPAFETGPFPAEFRFAGVPTLDLRVTPTGATGFLAAQLYAVPPDGAQDAAEPTLDASGRDPYRLGHALADIRFAQPDEAPATPLRVDHPMGHTGVPVARPLQPLDVRLEFEALDAVVPAGWGLRLVLSQGGGEWRYGTPTSALLVDTDDGSAVLTLDGFERGADRFFTPPGVAPAGGA